MVATSWQLETQERLEAAGRLAKATNRSVVVSQPPGKYEFERLEIPPHVSLIFGRGVSREADLVYVGTGYQTCVWMRPDRGYGSRLAGCQIRSSDPTAPRVTGIRVEGCINPVLQDVRVDLRGVDCVALDLAGRESIVGDRLELRATVPIRLGWGDNIHLRNLDCGCMNNGVQLPNTVMLLTGMPHQVSLGGSFTAQGGDNLIWGEIDSPKSGQGLSLYNCRWEQSTSLTSETKAAVHLVCSDRQLENLSFFGCRWTDRKYAWNVYGVDTTSQFGCRLKGR